MDDELEAVRQKKREELAARIAALKQGVIALDDATFPGAPAGHPFLVVDFWAEWCGPCRRIAPIFEALSGEFAGRVTFARCNVDDSPRAAASSGITVIPTLVFFAHGRMVGRTTGALPADALRAAVKNAFGLSE